VPEPTNPDKVDVEEASSRLDEGLRSCRAVVSGYRALLGGPVNNGGAANSNEAEESPDLPNDG
jgi:hypothetical protein